MSAFQAREQRHYTFLKARMRCNAGWVEAMFTDVSSRGIGLRCDPPPAKGTYAELTCGTVSIVARVVWVHDNRCGLRTQDRIDMAALRSNAAPRNASVTQERRPLPQAARARRPVTAEAIEANRHFGRAFQWIVLGLAAIAAASAAAAIASSALTTPMQQVRQAISVEQLH